uniref:outer membrane channel protein TolC n=1 Tax=Ningiella ruwaisensis TaxID=2364274 RepID=UPI00109F1AE4|nr:outer membrane channel protein TolC [Ningiella ruwaisensis]
MKKTILSIMLGLSFSASSYADDLMTVYQLAVDNDPIINRAEAQKNSAYAAIDLSRASLLPQLSGSVSYTDSTSEVFDQQIIEVDGVPRAFEFSGDNDTTTLNYGINLNMSLYDHANWLGLDRAELVAQQSDANLGSALQGLMQRTVTAYLAVLREQDNVEFVRAELRAIERQLEQTKQRFEVGLTAITDVHEAQANFDNTVARQIRAENLVELRLEELREITSQYHDELFVLDTDKFTAVEPTPNNPSEWLEIAKDANLELLAQRFAKDIAKENIDIARSGHLPTLALTGSYGINDRDSETTLNPAVEGQESQTFVNDPPRLDNRSLTLRLNVPIYEGGSVSAQTEVARADYVVASENLELTYRQTVRTVRSSFNDVKAAISTIRALEQSVVSAQSALQATEAGFDVGTRTIVDVLNSTRNLFDARRNLADARYNFITSIINLKRAAGTLTVADLQAINQALKPAPAEQN